MNQKPSNYFLFGLLLAVMVLATIMFLPFLTPLVLAAALAVVFGPLYRWITRIFMGGKERSNIAALITTLAVARDGAGASHRG
jgi:predicted PurR-regulated permease PerM